VIKGRPALGMLLSSDRFGDWLDPTFMSIDDLIWLVASLVELAVIGMLVYRRVCARYRYFFPIAFGSDE